MGESAGAVGDATIPDVPLSPPPPPLSVPYTPGLETFVAAAIDAYECGHTLAGLARELEGADVSDGVDALRRDRSTSASTSYGAEVLRLDTAEGALSVVWTACEALTEDPRADPQTGRLPDDDPRTPNAGPTKTVVGGFVRRCVLPTSTPTPSVFNLPGAEERANGVRAAVALVVRAWFAQPPLAWFPPDRLRAALQLAWDVDGLPPSPDGASTVRHEEAVEVGRIVYAVLKMRARQFPAM